jgi:hypothetical protein
MMSQRTSESSGAIITQSSGSGMIYTKGWRSGKLGEVAREGRVELSKNKDWVPEFDFSARARE